MMRKIVALFVTALAALAFGLPVHAGEDKKDNPCDARAGIHSGGYIHDYIGMYKDHASELALSAEQIRRLKELDEGCRSTCRILTSEIEEAEAELDNLLKVDRIDTKRLEERYGRSMP